MASRKRERLKELYLFSLKATGVMGLMYLPLMALVLSSGLVDPQEALPLMVLGPVLGLISLPICLLLLSDSGWPRFALRPRSFAGGFAGYVLLGLMGSLVLVLAVVTLALLWFSDLVAITGLDRILAPLLGVDPASDRVNMFVMKVLFIPLAIAVNVASILALVVRFDPSDLQPARAKGAEQPEPAAPAAQPERVRPPEHEAALRAMRKRMAERQAAARAMI